MSQGWRRTPLPTDWPHIRRTILQRDPTCKLAYPELCTTTSTQVDHIDDDANHQPTNLRGVCKPCHDKRSERQRLDALGVGPGRRRPIEQHPGLR